MQIIVYVQLAFCRPLSPLAPSQTCADHCHKIDRQRAHSSQVRHTVFSLCKDTQYKDLLKVRTIRLGINHCILTAGIPLGSGQFAVRTFFWYPKQ